MTAKKYAQVIIISALVLFLLVGVIGGLVIDPYSIFNPENIKVNGVGANRNYVKMHYILKYPEKYNAFMFGSSCVSAIHVEKINDVRCYNMTCSYIVPEEQIQNLTTMLNKGIKIDRIYLGVDSGSYTRSTEVNRNDPARCPYEYLREHPQHFVSLYMNPGIVLASLKIMIPYMLGLEQQSYLRSESYATDFFSSGATIAYGRKDGIDWNTPQMPTGGKYKYSRKVLDDIKTIADICRKNNIELIVFTNVTHYINYEACLNNNYLDFLEGLAEVTDFYNFSGFNDVGRDNNNFLDVGHYKAETGDMILDVIYGGKKFSGLYEQGFGWKVTRDNIKEFLAIPEISGN